MAITQDQIFAAADAIAAAGTTPTMQSVRAALGSGSYSTIGPALHDWRAQRQQQQAAAPVQGEPVPQAVTDRAAALAAHIWADALALADGRLAAERAALEQARIEMEAERAEAVAAADALQAELDTLQAALEQTRQEAQAEQQQAAQAQAQAAQAQAQAEQQAEQARAQARLADARAAEIERLAEALRIELSRSHQEVDQLRRAAQAQAAQAQAEQQQAAQALAAQAQALEQARLEQARLAGQIESQQLQISALLARLGPTHKGDTP